MSLHNKDVMALCACWRPPQFLSATPLWSTQITTCLTEKPALHRYTHFQIKGVYFLFSFDEKDVSVSGIFREDWRLKLQEMASIGT